MLWRGKGGREVGREGRVKVREREGREEGVSEKKSNGRRRVASVRERDDTENNRKEDRC